MSLRKQKSSRIADTIISILKNYAKPISLEELLQLAQVSQPTIAFSTIYRIMKRLEESKKVIRMDWRERGSRYEWTQRLHHHHIHCTACGQTMDIDDSVVQFNLERIATLTGYSLGNHHLVFEGVCHTCQEKVR